MGTSGCVSCFSVLTVQKGSKMRPISPNGTNIAHGANSQLMIFEW